MSISEESAVTDQTAKPHRDYKGERDEKVKAAITVLMDELNGGNRKEIAATVCQEIGRTHRTLQQSFWSMLLLAQIEYASSSSDLRNEESVQLAKAVKELAVKLNMDMGLAYI